MRKIFTTSFLVLLFFFTALLDAKGPGLEQKGMSLGLFSKDPNYSYLKDLEEMKELGVTHVQLVVSWYQKDVKATEIGPRDYDGGDIMTLPDAKLREVIDQAHSLGMAVMVFPILRLEIRVDKDWRGVIAPSDLEAWWKSYNQFILHYAKLGSEQNTEILAVGSELLSREKDTAQWEDLIRQVKEVYNGKLIYSSNWDHYQHPEFWKSLDYVGMTAYHELTKSKNPTLKELKMKWAQIQRELLSWKRKYPRQKLIITEIGYPSIDGTCMYPWNYFLEGGVDVKEQALCYRAFIDTWKRSTDLAGVYFWVWWGEGGSKDNSYTPRGKPAMKWLSKWYQS